MIQSPFSNLPPVVKNLLMINLVLFIPVWLFDHFSPVGWWTQHLAVYYFDSPKFEPWQLITYMFMHGSFEHILFNMFALFSFGPMLEYTLGSKKFFNFYFICGLGAVALQLAVQAFEVHAITGGLTISNPSLDSSYLIYADKAQKLYDIYQTPLVGASGAIFGLLIAFGMIYPNAELLIFFIPVPVKAKYLIPVYVVIEVVLGFGQFGGDNVAHFAHIGGALFGFILVKLWRIQGPRNFYN